MLVDQSEGTKEIQGNVEVLARSATSNKTGHQTHQWKPDYSPKPGSKGNDQTKGMGETDSLGDFLKWEQSVKQGSLFSQLRWKKQACLGTE